MSPSLAHTFGHDLAKERHLCPVRCMKVYKAYQGRKEALISFQRTSLQTFVRTPFLDGLNLDLTLFILMTTKMPVLLKVEVLIPFGQWLLLLQS